MWITWGEVKSSATYLVQIVEISIADDADKKDLLYPLASKLITVASGALAITIFLAECVGLILNATFGEFAFKVAGCSAVGDAFGVLVIAGLAILSLLFLWPFIFLMAKYPSKFVLDVIAQIDQFSENPLANIRIGVIFIFLGFLFTVVGMGGNDYLSCTDHMGHIYSVSVMALFSVASFIAYQWKLRRPNQSKREFYVRFIVFDFFVSYAVIKFPDAPYIFDFKMQFFSMFFLGTLMSAFVYKRKEENARMDERELALNQQVALMQSRLAPHWLVGSMTILKNYVNRLEKSDKKDDLLQMVTALYKYSSYICYAYEKKDCTLKEEFIVLRSLLEISTPRMPGLCYEFDLQPEIEYARVPPLILEPLVQNSLRSIHDDAVAKDSGKLIIRAINQDTFILIQIMDNGAGLSTEQMKLANEKGIMPKTTKGEGGGFGLIATKTIVDGINGASLTFEPGIDEKGILVTIKLPLIL